MGDKKPPPPPVLPKPKISTSVQMSGQAKANQESRSPSRIVVPDVFLNNPPTATPSGPSPGRPNTILAEPRPQDAGFSPSPLTSPTQAQSPAPPVITRPKPQPRPPQTQPPVSSVAANTKPKFDFKRAASSGALQSQPFNYLCPSPHSPANLVNSSISRPTSQPDVHSEARSASPPTLQPLSIPSLEPAVVQSRPFNLSPSPHPPTNLVNPSISTPTSHPDVHSEQRSASPPTLQPSSIPNPDPAVVQSRPFNFLRPLPHPPANRVNPDTTRPTFQSLIYSEPWPAPPVTSEPLSRPIPEPAAERWNLNSSQETNLVADDLYEELFLRSNSQKNANKSRSNSRLGSLRKKLSKLKIGVPAQRISKLFQRKTPSSPRYPQHVAEASRLRTFRDWHKNPSPKDLAEAGFFYAGYDDSVKCFFCGIELCGWKSTQDPWIQHIYYRPKCPFVIQSKGEDFIKAISFDCDSEPIYSTIDSDGDGEELLNTPEEDVDEYQISTPLPQESPSPTPRPRFGFDWESPVTSFRENVVRTSTSEETESDHVYVNLPTGAVSGNIPRLSADEEIPSTLERDQITRPISNEGLPTGDLNDEAARRHDNGGSPIEDIIRSYEDEDTDLYFDIPSGSEDASHLHSLSSEFTGPPTTTEAPPALFAVTGDSPETLELSARGVTDDEVMSSMNTVMVKLVLDLDFPAYLVEMAVRQKLQEDGEDFSSPEDLVEAILYLADEDDQDSVVETAEQTEGPGPTQEDNASSTDISDPRKLEAEIHRLQEEKKCKVCLDGEICITFIPCGHFSCCAACAAKLKTCPICRKGITCSVRTYMS